MKNSDAREFAEPWHQLREALERADVPAIQSLIDDVSGGELARALRHLSESERNLLLTLLAPDNAADLMEEIPEHQAASILEELPAKQVAAILDAMPSDERVDILHVIGDESAKAALAEMSAETADATRDLLQYEDNVAGGLMITEFLAFSADSTVATVIDDLRINADAYRDYEIQYAYIVDAERRLMGVLRLRDLLLARATDDVKTFMISEPLSVSSQADLHELIEVFDKHSFFGVPVVEDDELVGVLRRASVEEAMGDEAARSQLKSTGIAGGEESRSMPLFNRARGRLSWLSVNILLNVVAASVIAAYQETLQAAIALAVFLPIISDMSGCSGNQAVAVSLRELSLGVVKPRDAGYVWLKEVSVGVINGVVLGLLIGSVAWLWQGNPWLGLVVGGALALNTVIAVSIGGLVPLLLRRLKVDPALASGPILTTITDLCGFLLVLGLATALLARIA